MRCHDSDRVSARLPVKVALLASRTSKAFPCLCPRVTANGPPRTPDHRSTLVTETQDSSRTSKEAWTLLEDKEMGA
jgi:hypothetical protein